MKDLASPSGFMSTSQAFSLVKKCMTFHNKSRSTLRFSLFDVLAKCILKKISVEHEAS